MNKLIKLLIKYQETNDEVYLEKIIKMFDRLINKYVSRVEPDNKEDIKQILIIKIYNVIKNFHLNNKYYKDNNSIIVLKINDKECLLDISYLDGFNNKYGSNLIDEAFLSEKSLLDFITEYVLFNNENQLTRYLEKTFNNVILKYYKEKNKQININYSLNEINEYGEEYINLIIDQNSKLVYKINVLDETESVILDLLMKKYTQKEIGKILGMSQQAVNKRKKQIIKKLEKDEFI